MQLLTTSQHRRIGVDRGVDEILEHEWFEGMEVKSIQDQSYVSPIYEIVTDQQTIIELTSMDCNRGENTSFWMKKENKAMKLIAKNFIDYGNHWKSQFDAFDFMNVEFEDEEIDPMKGSMRVRRHAMSSISKQRNASLSEIMVKDKLKSDLSVSPINMSPFSIGRVSVNKSDEQGNVNIFSPASKNKILDFSDEVDSPEIKIVDEVNKE